MLPLDSQLQIINDNLQLDVNDFKAQINELKKTLLYYKCAVDIIESRFKTLGEEFSFMNDYNPIEGIKSRVKSIESILQKMQKCNLPFTIDALKKNIYDIAGVRIICSFIDDVYYLKETLLKQDDIKLIEIKDYIKNPKENGYRSLHIVIEIPVFLSNEKTKVKVEVQFRTLAMDFWASLEHKLLYKQNHKMTTETIKTINECAVISANLDSKFNDARRQLIK